MSRLLLLPNSLAEEISPDIFPPEMVQKVAQIDGLIAESEKRARRFLRCFSFSEDRTFRDLPIALLNEHRREVEELLEPLKRGETWGLISDGGMPCLADPGAKLIAKARMESIAVEMFSGPSSMITTLLLSGLPAQSFAFHGYFPREKEELKAKVQMLCRRSAKERAPQIFIEAPYRCHHRLQDLIDYLPESSLLCTGCDIMEKSQEVICQSVRRWRKSCLPDLRKKRVVFIFYLPASCS